MESKRKIRLIQESARDETGDSVQRQLLISDLIDFRALATAIFVVFLIAMIDPEKRLAVVVCLECFFLAFLRGKNTSAKLRKMKAKIATLIEN